MLAECNMDSLMSIKNEYLNAVATLLSVSQQHQQQQQQQQKQQVPANNLNHQQDHRISTQHIDLANRSPNNMNLTRAQRRKPQRFHQQQIGTSHKQHKTMKPTMTTTCISSPLDLTLEKRLSNNLPETTSLLAKIIPQSSSRQQQTIVPLDLVTKHGGSALNESHYYIHNDHQKPSLLITSSTGVGPISSSTSSCSSLSRPSSVNSSSFQATTFQEPQGRASSASDCVTTKLMDDLAISRNQCDRLISSSNSGANQKTKAKRPVSSASGSGNNKKSSTKGNRSHLCKHCGRTFSRSDMLTRHSRLHSGHKPYQCAKCLQVFSRSDHLSTHERTHTGEKPYQCNFCSYSACRRDMITRHMRTHTTSLTPTANEIIPQSTTNNPNSSRRPPHKTPRRQRPLKSTSHDLHFEESHDYEDHDDVSTSIDLSLS